MTATISEIQQATRYRWKGVDGFYGKLSQDDEPMTQGRAIGWVRENWTVVSVVPLGPDRFVATVRNLLSGGEKQLTFRGFPLDRHAAIEQFERLLTAGRLTPKQGQALIEVLKELADEDPARTSESLLAALDVALAEAVL